MLIQRICRQENSTFIQVLLKSKKHTESEGRNQGQESELSGGAQTFVCLGENWLPFSLKIGQLGLERISNSPDEEGDVGWFLARQ